MGRFVKADLKIKSVYDLDIKMLKSKGIKGILFDIDNTIEEYATPMPSEKTLEFFRQLSEEGFKIGIISNAKYIRVAKFIKGFPSKNFPELHCIAHAGKPFRKAFRLLSMKMDLKRSEIAMIGDQLFTDIWGGNRAKCFTVLVEPINRKIEPKFVKFKRLLEKPFM